MVYGTGNVLDYDKVGPAEVLRDKSIIEEKLKNFEEKTFFSTVLIYEMYSSDTSYNFNSLIGISYREKGDHGDHPSILKFPTVWQGIS